MINDVPFNRNTFMSMKCLQVFRLMTEDQLMSCHLVVCSGPPPPPHTHLRKMILFSASLGFGNVPARRQNLPVIWVRERGIYHHAFSENMPERTSSSHGRPNSSSVRQIKFVLSLLLFWDQHGNTNMFILSRYSRQSHPPH